MNAQMRQMKREKFEALAPKGSTKLGRYIYMRTVSKQALDSFQSLGFTVILVGGSK